VDVKQRRRIYYSAAQRSEIWDRWQAGEPMSSQIQFRPVCIENLVRVDDVMESPKLAGPGKKKAATGLRFGDGFD